MALNNEPMGKAKSELGNNIQRLRKSLGFTQEEFAEVLRISRTHIGHIEQGRKAPSLKLMEKIAKTLKIPLSELFKFKKR